MTDAVDQYFEGVKSVLIGIVDLTVEPDSEEGSPVAELIDEKRSLRGIVFLRELVQKRNCWIGAMPTNQCDIKNRCCLDVYYIV